MEQVILYAKYYEKMRPLIQMQHRRRQEIRVELASKVDQVSELKRENAEMCSKLEL
jgi:hypothetical protein